MPGQGFIHQQEGSSIRSAAVGRLISRDHSRSDQSLGRSAQPMSLLGQSRRFDDAPITSGLPLLTDIGGTGRHVSKVPQTDTCEDLYAK